MDVHNTLLSFGLTKKEVQIYLQLLRVGTSPASSLAQRTDILRSTAHYICQQLVKKGLVSKVLKNNVYLFTAEPPSRLSLLFEKKKHDIERDEERLQEVLAELEGMANPNSPLPKIRIFEGREGIITAYRHVLDELKEGQEIQGYLYAAFLKDDIFDLKDAIHNFVQERVRKNVSLRVIALPTPASTAMQKTDKKNLRQTRIVHDIPYRGTSVEILIYNDKLFSISIESNICFACIVEHMSITEMHRTMFELAWRAAPIP